MAETQTDALSGIAQILSERRTVHDFKSEVPPLSVITKAVELARWAPNHHRTEPWHFYILDRAVAHHVADLNARLVRESKGEKVAEIKRRRWRDIPGWIVVSCETSEDPIRAREDYAACCCAVHNMSLYLWDQAIGMKWTTGAVTREKEFFDLIGLDFENAYVVGLFWYGFPAAVPTQHRKPVSAILSHVVQPQPEE